MKLFEIVPDDDGFPYEYDIDAAHRWGLPGVRCPDCGFIGGAVGVCYPDLGVPAGTDESPYESGWPVAPARVRELARPLEMTMPGNFPFPAGTEFGPLTGRASGKLGDFAWLNPWTPLISPDALEKLAMKGISNLRTVSTDIRLRSKSRQFKHLELCLFPIVHARDPEPSRKCSKCGMPLEREPNKIEPSKPVILIESWPKGVHLTRVFEAPGFIVASEDLVEAVKELHLTDVKFEQLQAR